jgi:serine-type D-Ala-D-Ala carboxypeptidase/endopeptidase (penicillin-binding protein 4)
VDLAKGGHRVNPVRRSAVLTLALLICFTIAAGAAVAHLLPPRLALWRLPSVAVRPVAGSASVLPQVPLAGTDSGAVAATPAGVTAALAPELDSGALGTHIGALVTDLGTGEVLYSADAGSGFQPASTTKLATAIAALHVLGPGHRMATRVLAGDSDDSIVLVGGGDPTLAAGPAPAGQYPQPATLASLAAKTARALRAKGVRSVRLSYDTALYTGPALAAGWPDSYVTTGNVSPISPLEVDQGRLTVAGAPQDAYDALNQLPRSATPALEATAAFAAYLARNGIQVLGQPARSVPPRGSATIAEVRSPPLSEIVQWMLTYSDNVMAENVARQVAIATGRPASFSGAAAAVNAVVAKLGVSSGIHMVDGSGLSPRDRITPDALIKLIGLAASAGQPQLRAVITGLPVAGFSGTLAPGGSAFDDPGRTAFGVVRAKTGNLLTVVALAGLAYAKNGQLLAFAFMADKLPAGGLDAAGSAMAGLATALAGCGCR